ncbi:GIY-YIG nuclease family protein [Oceaniglobus trochenteri]|uniref:GIY-YIG nuclease family protein n=1 Tax=Oceaniglobus trochenteri TaxID=2763260 RepID=UPI001CFFC7C1|nr:GIY-YIG nuclease family protein [Oceaniglobus trochenteri]
MTATALYRHYDADGALLYVGVTCDPCRRIAQHESGSSWYTQVASVEVQWFDAREIAIAAERYWISEHNPVHNKNHKTAPVSDHGFLCAEIAAFAAEVVDFGKRHGLKPSTIMQNACLNGKSWNAIVSGKDLTMGTASRARSWMRERDREERAAGKAGAA